MIPAAARAKGVCLESDLRERRLRPGTRRRWPTCGDVVRPRFHGRVGRLPRVCGSAGPLRSRDSGSRHLGWIGAGRPTMCVFFQYFVTRARSRFQPLAIVATGMDTYAAGAGSVCSHGEFLGSLVEHGDRQLGRAVAGAYRRGLIASQAPADLRGRYMSTYWLAWGCSRAVAPVVGGLLSHVVSPGAIWYGALVTGMASTAGLVLLAARARQGPPVWVTGRPDASWPYGDA